MISPLDYVYFGSSRVSQQRVKLSLGTKSDWESLLKKSEKLLEYGDQTKQWHRLLKPVLTHFVAAFDEPESRENKAFWQKIAHVDEGGSGPHYLSGWITAFCFFDNKGMPPKENSLASRDGANLGGVQFHRVETGDIPPAYAEVDVLLDDNGQEFNTIMVAGSVGVRVSDSGVTTGGGDGKQDTLQAEAGWWIFDKKP